MNLTIPPFLSGEHTELRTELQVAMRVEEEVLSPTTIVLGESLKTRLSGGSRTFRSSCGGRP